jgi:FliG C-terminal domain
MAMVDRYNKSGGFLQLLQVIETCGPKKREQFLNIISEETPHWAEAIKAKMLSFEIILGWRPEAILEIMAHVNQLAFVTALKSLPPDQLNAFYEKMSPVERRRIETQIKESSADPNQISSCVMKVVSETRVLFSTNKLKFDKVDPALAIPDEYESIIAKAAAGGGVPVAPGKAVGAGGSTAGAAATGGGAAATTVAEPTPIPVNVSGDVDQLRRKVVELTQMVNTLKKDNVVMRDKLEKIKKIA